MLRLSNRPPKYRRHKARNRAVVSFQGKQVDSSAAGIRRKAANGTRKFLAGGEKPKKIGTALGTPRRLRSCERVRSPEAMCTWSNCATSTHNMPTATTGKTGRSPRGGNGPRNRRPARRTTPWYGRKRVWPFDLDQFRNWLITEKDWSRKSINKQVARIVRMFKWGVSKEVVPPQTHQALASLSGLKKGRTNARELPSVQSVHDEVVENTLPHLSQIVADMVRLQRLTGCRPIEICDLPPCDVDRSEAVWRYVVANRRKNHERGVTGRQAVSHSVVQLGRFT